MSALGRWIRVVRDIGVADQDVATVRRMWTLNILVMMACIFTLSYCVFYTAYDATYFRVEIAFLLAMSALYPTALLATRRGRVELAMWMMIATAFVHLGTINWLLGAEGGALSYLLAVPFILSLITRDDDRFTIWPVAIAVGAIFMVVSFSDRKGSIAGLPETVRNLFFFVNILGAVLLACGISLVFRWFISRAESDLIAEQARSDRLLRAILPQAVARQLKSDERRIIARQYPEATAVFADIVGFTQRSAQTDADRIVTDLNRVFSRIDDLADRHGIEKIKTIGDAYFAVCGLPDPVTNHAERAASFALDVQKATRELADAVWPDLSLRVVIHSGPVVAGVIGRTKFAYDVWGDTINTAARLEEVCKPGQILITHAVADALGGSFATEPLGTVHLRDKGELPIHALLDRRDPI